MKKVALTAIVSTFMLVFGGVSGCRSADERVRDSDLEAARNADTSDVWKNNTIDLTKTQYRGRTYLDFMNNVVKKKLDEVAAKGYKVGDAAAMEAAYKGSDKKVQQKVDRLWGGLDNVKAIAEKLKGQTVTLDSLPLKIKQVDKNADIYGLATFIGLASGGGVAIKYAPNNIAYNIHYDETEQRSGRSFGTGPGRGANDASDKQFLDDLEQYGKEEDINAFYRPLLNMLLTLDPTGYEKISNFGQGVLTDFLAVYTAEQDRNLMDGKVTLHWDAALLEVTLLSAFHSKQNPFTLYYNDPKTRATSFVTRVYNQAPGCDKVTGSLRQARMRDYWQFSKSTDPKNCKRSGINITKNEFRKLGRRITSYMIAKHRREFDNVAKAIDDTSSTNVYESLSVYLLNKAPAKISPAKAKQITESWIAFLKVTAAEANKITKEKETSSSDTDGGSRLEAEADDQVSDGFSVIYDEDARLGIQ